LDCGCATEWPESSDVGVEELPWEETDEAQSLLADEITRLENENISLKNQLLLVVHTRPEELESLRTDNARLEAENISLKNQLSTPRANDADITEEADPIL
jgi:hypothetical protein